jgi:hypothetical protein
MSEKIPGQARNDKRKRSGLKARVAIKKFAQSKSRK